MKLTFVVNYDDVTVAVVKAEAVPREDEFVTLKVDSYYAKDLQFVVNGAHASTPAEDPAGKVPVTFRVLRLMHTFTSDEPRVTVRVVPWCYEL